MLNFWYMLQYNMNQINSVKDRYLYDKYVKYIILYIHTFY